MKKLKFIEVKSEIGAGTRGASMAVDAIKIAALDYGSALFNQIPSIEVPNENKALFDSAGQMHAKRIKNITALCDRVANTVKTSLKNNEFPIVLAGDHSTSYGTITGIRMAYPKQKLGVVWIDAHADIHSPWTTPSGNMHGMPIAAALGEDNASNRMNRPDKETLELWTKFKNLGGFSPKIDYGNLVFISLRDVEPEETFLLKKHKVKIFSVADVKRNGVERIARDALSYLNKC